MSSVLVRPVGPLGAAQRTPDALTLRRPRTSLSKQFRLSSVESSCSTAQLHVEHVAPRIHAALASGESLYVLSAGAAGSGKSTTLRALLPMGCDALYSAAAEAEGEWMVCASAVLCVATPTRERVVDALRPIAEEQPKAGLCVRQIDADGLPHATPFAVEGLSRPVVRTASDARAMFARAIERCEHEEKQPTAIAVHLLASLTLHRKLPDGAEAELWLSFADLAGRPRQAAAAKPSARGVGEDPVMRAYHRVIDARDQGLGHIPFRDSAMTKLLQPALGGSAAALHLLHVRLEDYAEAEAALRVGLKLASCAAAAAPLCWRPRARLDEARRAASALCQSLGVEAAGLTSSAVALDERSAEEMVELRRVLLLAERLEARLAFWDHAAATSDGSRALFPLAGGEESQALRAAAVPPARAQTKPLQAANGSVDASRLALLKSKHRRGAEASTPSLDEPLKVGHRVLARFDNGEYYAAKLTRTDAARERYSVEFEDDGVRRDGLTRADLRPHT
ncbi:hypothetical protein AB1Y20_010949 [Prymnesium parvum]|uniref:Kinesin motor domain-containing protein n=1 Tax=Prymnesium parvum TaxID=97485 RepID=A0AB34ISV3_PRYPA